MQLKRHHLSPRSRGFTLLEVLLGLSGLQTTSLRNNHSAFLRSQATLVTHDIIDRMRANRASAMAGNYDITYTATPTTVTCTSGCTALQVAGMDLIDWRAYVERLPGGEGEIEVSGGGLAEVRLRWTDARDSATANKQVFETRVQL